MACAAADGPLDSDWGQRSAAAAYNRADMKFAALLLLMGLPALGCASPSGACLYKGASHPPETGWTTGADSSGDPMRVSQATARV